MVLHGFTHFMAHAMPSHASATHLWSLSTLSCPASNVLPLVMSHSVQYSVHCTVLPYHVDQLFLWFSPLPDSMNIAVACSLLISFILHPGQMTKVAQSLVLYSVNYAASDV